MSKLTRDSTPNSEFRSHIGPDIPPLPDSDYAIVCSAVLFQTPRDEILRNIAQFRKMSSELNLKTHLILIDNSPCPALTTSPEGSDISYFFARQNLGYGRAHNLAIRASQGRTHYNLIMNTDVVYDPQAVGTLKQTLDMHRNAGLAAPKIYYPDGSLQYVCRLLPKPKNVFLRRFFPNLKITKRADYIYELRWWHHNAIADIPFFQGSFLLVRSDILDIVSGFDERFFLYAEDIDMCRRIHQISKTLFIPEARIIHEFRRYSNRSLRGTLYSIRSHCQYFNKWGWFFDKARTEINSRTIEDLQSS